MAFVFSWDHDASAHEFNDFIKVTCFKNLHVAAIETYATEGGSFRAAPGVYELDNIPDTTKNPKPLTVCDFGDDQVVGIAGHRVEAHPNSDASVVFVDGRVVLGARLAFQSAAGANVAFDQNGNAFYDVCGNDPLFSQSSCRSGTIVHSEVDPTQLEIAKSPSVVSRFDCTKPADNVELLICQTASLEISDIKMTEAYRKAPAQGYTQAPHSDDQQHWLSSLSASCNIPTRGPLPLPPVSNVLGRSVSAAYIGAKTCLLREYDARVSKLNKAPSRR